MAINIQGGLYATCAYSTDSTTTTAPTEGDCNNPNSATSWKEFSLSEVLTYLKDQSTTLLNPICFGAARRRLQSDNSAQDYSESRTETYYPGVALVLSGPMTVSVNLTPVTASFSLRVSHVMLVATSSLASV